MATLIRYLWVLSLWLDWPRFRDWAWNLKMDHLLRSHGEQSTHGW